MWVACHRGSCKSSGIVPPCHCRYVVGPKYFLVGVSWVSGIFSWVFRGSQIFFLEVTRGSKIFSRRYFLAPKFFLVTSKFSLVGNLVILSCWPHEKKVPQKYMWNWASFSKSILTIVNSISIRKALHLLNYLCYYAALVWNNCSFSHLFFQVESLHLLQRYIVFAKLEDGFNKECNIIISFSKWGQYFNQKLNCAIYSLCFPFFLQSLSSFSRPFCS